MKGVLFRNEQKKSDTYPDYNGSSTINGIEYWINGWVNQSKSTGKPYLKIVFKEKEQKQNVLETTNSHEFNDEIPF